MATAKRKAKAKAKGSKPAHAARQPGQKPVKPKATKTGATKARSTSSKTAGRRGSTRKQRATAQPAPGKDPASARGARQKPPPPRPPTARVPGGKGSDLASAAAITATPPSATDKSVKAAPKQLQAKSAQRQAVETARRNLKALAAIVEQSNDRDAELILGEGRLEALLRAVLPPRRRSAKTTYDYLAAQKRRASLMAQVRHSINTAYSFPTGIENRFLSPTRVQWFYDGLTFIEGPEPFAGVVGLYRNGELRYGIDVKDTPANGSLGPNELDFVSLEAAKRSFGAAHKPSSTARSDIQELQEGAAQNPERWLSLLERYPWMLGAQHTALVRVRQDDPNMPEWFLRRVEDTAHDVLLMGQPDQAVFAKSGRMQRSFQDMLHQAEQTLSFVQRQAGYLRREFDVLIQRPRAFVIAGRGLSQSERDTLRHYSETRHAELRVSSFDDLGQLALKTASFFEARF